MGFIEDHPYQKEIHIVMLPKNYVIMDTLYFCPNFESKRYKYIQKTKSI